MYVTIIYVFGVLLTPAVSAEETVEAGRLHVSSPALPSMTSNWWEYSHRGNGKILQTGLDELSRLKVMEQCAMLVTLNNPKS